MLLHTRNLGQNNFSNFPVGMLNLPIIVIFVFMQLRWQMFLKQYDSMRML